EPAGQLSSRLAGFLATYSLIMVRIPLSLSMKAEFIFSDAALFAFPAGWTRLPAGVARFACATRDVSLTSLSLFRPVHFLDSVNFESEPAGQPSSQLAIF